MTYEEVNSELPVEFRTGDAAAESNLPTPRFFTITKNGDKYDICALGLPEVPLERRATATTCIREGRFENVTCAGATKVEKATILLLELESHISALNGQYWGGEWQKENSWSDPYPLE